MKGLRTIIFLLLFLLAVFVLANWSVLTTETSLSLLAYTLEAPLGLVLLGVIGLFVLLFTAHALTLRTSWLLENRRHYQELRAQRELADRSESSRITELRNQLERGLAELRKEIQSAESVRGEALSSAEQSLRKTIEQSTSTLKASIRDLEDRVGRSRPVLASGSIDRSLDRRDESVG